MSEQLPKSPETNVESLGNVTTAERPAAAEYSHADHEQAVEQAQAAVAVEAGRGERPALPIEPVDDRPQLIDHTAKLIRMRRSLATVQSTLSPNARSFSKVVHQPLVQKVSESASKTVARPSGMLGGGVTAFVGCLGYQLLVRHYGMPYNFSFFLVFFIGGFGLGLLGEYALRQARKLHR